MTDIPPVRVTGHPEHGDFDGWLVLSPSDWPWWLVLPEGDHAAPVVTHHSLVSSREETTA